MAALYQRNRTGRGQRVLCAMQDGVLNLARVKLRDQQRLKHGPLEEYSQFGEGVPFGKAVPRAGNDSGGGQPGWILKCKGWETDPDSYIYFITQAPVWEPICDLIGKPEWKTDPDYAKPPARLPRLKHIFATIEAWTMTKTKFEVMDMCNQHDIPVGPILSMKEIAEEQSLRDTGTVVEVDHPTRGHYLTVGNPIKLSDSPCDVKRSPLLGEHTDEILTKVLGYGAKDVAAIKASGAIYTSADAAITGAARLSHTGEVLPAECGDKMRIVVHGQQAFGKAVLEALLKRGDEVVAVYVAPEKPGQKPDPVEGRRRGRGPAGLSAGVVSQAGSLGRVPRAEARPAGDGVRHAVRAGRVPQHPDARLDPVSPFAAAGASRRVGDQLADHPGREGNGPVDLLARQRARHRRRAAAEEDADFRHRHARQRLFRSPVPDGRRGDARSRSTW